jgi:hypothetical protein
LNLASLHGQIDFRTILVTGERIEFCSEGFLQEISNIVASRSRTGGAAFWWNRCFTHVVKRFVRSVSADVDDLLDLCRSAEPSELWPIKLNFFSPHELIEIESGPNPSEG